MVNYSYKEFLSQLPMKTWGLISFLIGICIIFVEISISKTGETSITLFNISFKSFIYKGGAIWFGYYCWIILVLSIISFPKLMSEIISKNRIGFFLSSSLSRNRFIMEICLGVFYSSFSYSIIAILSICVPLFLKTSELPLNLVFALLTIPILLIGLFLLVAFLSVIVDSYSSITTITIFYTIVISYILDIRGVLPVNEFILNIMELFFYITPQYYEILSKIMDIYNNGTINGIEIFTIIASFIPTIGGLFYFLAKKEF